MAIRHPEVLHGTCLGCIPLKVGVVLYGIYVLLLSVLATASVATEDWRVFVGGYTFGTRGLVTLLGVVGLVFSSGALIGVYDNNTDWVRSFARFAFLRVFVVAAIVYFDMATLKTCDAYTIDGSKFGSVNGNYNIALETVALSGKCKDTQKWYLILGIFDVCLSLVGAYNTSRWSYIVDNHPTYQIAIDESYKVYQGYGNLGRHAAREQA